MPDLDRQTAYWDAAAPTKRFTHPLYEPWLDGVGRDAVIVDYGCGYGRTMEELSRLGFHDLSGVDTSPGMIDRARSLHPAMDFAVLDAPPALARAEASADMVLLFAVLTCVPDDDAQRRLIDELGRVLRPGGLLYLSDMLLQDDERNRGRYAAFAERHGTYGVFETDDGAVCRHHAGDWFPALLAGFTTVGTRRTDITTMNGHPSAGVQILARKPPAGKAATGAEAGAGRPAAGPLPG